MLTHNTTHNTHRQREERQREQQLEEGQDCTLVLQLPDGAEHMHTFKLGATVAFLKLCVQVRVDGHVLLLLLLVVAAP